MPQREAAAESDASIPTTHRASDSSLFRCSTGHSLHSTCVAFPNGGQSLTPVPREARGCSSYVRHPNIKVSIKSVQKMSVTQRITDSLLFTASLFVFSLLFCFLPLGNLFTIIHYISFIKKYWSGKMMFTYALAKIGLSCTSKLNVIWWNVLIVKWDPGPWYHSPTPWSLLCRPWFQTAAPTLNGRAHIQYVLA